MTDLETTKLCAEAMGWEWTAIHTKGGLIMGRNEGLHFDPLHDDAQAMALVKRFALQLTKMTVTSQNWCVYSGNAIVGGYSSESEDLNRAICECVAKMQAAKS